MFSGKRRHRGRAGSGPPWGLALLGITLVSIGAAPLPAQSTASEQAALATLEAFLKAFNERDAQAWVATLRFPHLRLGPGGHRVWEDAEAALAEPEFEALAATGWRRSMWDVKEPIQDSESRVHVAVQFSRYGADEAPLGVFQGLYLVTRGEDGRWGLQARFTGVRPAPPERRAAIEATALDVIERFMSTFNARDAAAWAGTLNFPHVRISDADLRLWETAEEYVGYMDFERFARQAGGWDRSAWESRRVVWAGEESAIVALRFNRYRADGTLISSFPTAYFLTLQDGRWGVRGRSSFAP